MLDDIDESDESDEPDEFDEPDDLPTGWRTVGTGLSVLVVVPAVLMQGWLLLMYLPEATGYDCADGDPSCHYEVADTVLWWLILVTVVVGPVSVVLCWWRRWHAGPWWPWPALALSSAVLGVVLGQRLVWF
jgi:hypothetical protein